MTKWNPNERRTSRRRRDQGKWHQTRKGYWYVFLDGRWREVIYKGERLKTERDEK
jgi:hypothetical protein